MSLDNAGTPLEKKETSDVKNIENKGVEDTPKYQNGGTTQGPYQSTTPSFTERIKNRINSGVQTVKQAPKVIYENVKREVTVENVKRVGGNIVHNVGENLKSDVKEGGREIGATVRSIGISDESYHRRYGENAPQPLFRGIGGYGGDIFGKSVRVKVSNKSKKKKTVIKNKTLNIENVGVVGSVFGKGTATQSIHTTKMKQKNIDSLATMKLNSFGGGIKVKPFTVGTINVKKLSNEKKTRSPLENLNSGSKSLNGMKFNNSFELSAFKKKRKGGLL